eukprot:3722854-Rhodomonas_salina.1
MTELESNDEEEQGDIVCSSRGLQVRGDTREGESLNVIDWPERMRQVLGILNSPRQVSPRGGWRQHVFSSVQGKGYRNVLYSRRLVPYIFLCNVAAGAKEPDIEFLREREFAYKTVSEDGGVFLVFVVTTQQFSLSELLGLGSENGILSQLGRGLPALNPIHHIVLRADASMLKETC